LWGRLAACPTELDYAEPTSSFLFLKYLDGLEQDKADEAALDGRKHAFILEKPYRWEEWAAPKGRDRQIDHNRAGTGDDLRDFVNLRLFPYLHGFKLKATGPNTIEYKIGEIFGEIKNKISSGYNLREIIDHTRLPGFTSPLEGATFVVARCLRMGVSRKNTAHKRNGPACGRVVGPTMLSLGLFIYEHMPPREISQGAVNYSHAKGYSLHRRL